MCGPRASTERMMFRGERCQRCMTYLGPSPERLCARCTPASPQPPRKPVASERTHRVYVSFFQRDGWNVSFVESDLKTPVCRGRTFQSVDKLFALAGRGAEDKTLAGKQALDAAIAKGRGGMWLLLTDEQYRALKR